MKRVIISFVFTCLLFSSCYTSPGECISGDCYNGFGERVRRDGTTYVGEWKNGKYHGTGTEIYSIGGKYEGEWKKGKHHGVGTLIDPNGNQYVGEFEEGMKTGHGVYTMKDGSNFIGQMENNYTHGLGTWKYANGNSYSGNFQLGNQHGKGIWIEADGSKYSGDFEKGTMHGQGRYDYSDGSSYTGKFLHGKRSGQGRYDYSDGSSYTGKFLNGKRSGQGTLNFSDGRKYTGGFKEDKKYGFGNFSFPDGSYYVGEYSGDKKQGRGALTKADGSIDAGFWVDGKLTNPLTLELVTASLKQKYLEISLPNYEISMDEISEYNVTEGSETSQTVEELGLSAISQLESEKSNNINFISESISTVEPNKKILEPDIFSSQSVAVLEFEGKNVSGAEASALTDRLRNELFQMGHFKIVERGQMDEILNEQAFQQTGCVSSECAVEVGKILSVDYIIMGSVSKVGTIFSVSARLVNVLSGEIAKTAVYDHNGDLGGLLTVGMNLVAKQLGS